MKIDKILTKALNDQRISTDEAIYLLRETSLTEIGYVANLICEKHHPERIATFQIDRNINYTNICKNECLFCAFYRPKGHPEAYVLSQEEIERKVAETISLSGTQVMLQGGINPDLGIEYYTNMFKNIKSKFNIRIHSLSPPEIAYLSEREGLSISDTLKVLIDSGLDSLPGGGAEILVDRVRKKISPRKISSSKWLEVMEEAHKLNLLTTATMMMGSVETVEERVYHLEKIRDLQDRTGGFISFIPWTYQPGNTVLGGEKASTIEYLKLLSLSRIFLDNFKNIQGSWVTQGKDIGQLCLSFGANDLGSIMIEENVVRSTGISYRMSEEEMVYIIKKANKIPAKRDTSFNILKTYE